MDLSKSFDTIKHDLSIAKRYAYGFSKDSLELLYSYVSNRWYRTKINKKKLVYDKSWFKAYRKDLLFVPLFFSFYLNNLFYFATSTDVRNLSTIKPFMHVVKIKILLLTDWNMIVTLQLSSLKTILWN